jgi:hypothetical protein
VTTLTAMPSATPELDLAAPPSQRAKPAEVPTPAGSSNKADRIANVVVLTLLFAAPALMCVHAACANDFDLWWHLRTGEWILQHHAVPQVDPFSSTLVGKPWQAYSWLFEVILIKLFYRFGLVGMVAYTSTMVLAITAALYHSIKRLQADSSVAVLLTFAAGYGIAHLYTPRPWLFTILFFILELSILMHARRSGRVRGLLWLPLIFALWANIHIEYIDGLLVLGLAFAESIAARWWSAAETRVGPAWMGGALLASVLATVANPYGWRIYSVVFDYGSRLAANGSALNKVTELQAIPFRDPSDFTILALALLGVAALGWQRRFVLFETALLIFAIALSFRSQRDIWITAVVAVTILASRIVVSRKTPIQSPRFASPIAFVAAFLLLVAGFRVMHVNNKLLQTQVATTLPANAVQAIRAHGYTGPVYDDYNWGGYLIWALRQPVSMDGRASFYGDEKIDRSMMTWSAEPDWATDHDLMSAKVIIGPAKAALSTVLRTDPRFQLVYQDELAAVFIPRK